MGLCGSANCNCAFVGDGTTIDITGTGAPDDPFVISGSPIPDPVTNVYTGSTTTVSATWTKPARLKYVDVELQAPGGGSGGAATTAASQLAAAGCGGGGGYSRKRILAVDLGATESVTVGAAGTAGAAGNNDGGTGGTTSFGTHLSANGGAGGPGSAAQASSLTVGGNTANGGTATGGDINISGSRSTTFVCNSTGTRVRQGEAGRSVLSPGNPGVLSATASFAGVAGASYGGGAIGAVNIASDATARAGAIGGLGIITVTEYYE